MRGCREHLIRFLTLLQVRLNSPEHLWCASAHTPRTALTGDLSEMITLTGLLSEMITLASGASRTLKLLPALARHAANWGVPLTTDTFKSLRSALENASGDEIVREVLAASGCCQPLIACCHFMSSDGKPFPHLAGDCIGHEPLSGQSLADAHDKQLAHQCDSVTDLQSNPAWTSAASDPLQ